MSKKRFTKLSELGCCLCRKPAQIHHLIGDQGIKGLAIKASDEETIPLCEFHHTGKQGIHRLGVETWEKKYGSQKMWLDWTNRMLEYDI